MKAGFLGLFFIFSSAAYAATAQEIDLACLEALDISTFEFGTKIGQSVTFFGHFHKKASGENLEGGAAMFLNNGKLIQITSAGEVFKCTKSFWDGEEFDFTKNAFQLNIPYDVSPLAKLGIKFRVNPISGKAPKVIRCAESGEQSCWNEHVPACSEIAQKDRKDFLDRLAGLLILKRLKSFSSAQLAAIKGDADADTKEVALVKNKCGSLAAGKMRKMSVRIIEERAAGATVVPVAPAVQEDAADR